MDQYEISAWADETFGQPSSNIRIATRANEEMAELLRALAVNDENPKAPEEIADVIIVLYRLATRLGCDVAEEIARKMTVNRSRQWTVGNDGQGYHLRNKAPVV